MPGAPLFFLQTVKLTRMYFDQGQRVAKYCGFVNSQRPNSSPIKTDVQNQVA